MSRQAGLHDDDVLQLLSTAGAVGDLWLGGLRADDFGCLLDSCLQQFEVPGPYYGVILPVRVSAEFVRAFVA